MSQPVLLIVDAESGAREGLGRTLERRFGADYRIATASSAIEGLALLQGFARDGVDVALVIAALGMPGMDSIEFIERAHTVQPEALRLVLVGLGERAAMEPLHRGMALGQVDFFLFKPSWLWPEQWLYPQIQEALGMWTRTRGPQFEIVRIVGDQWSARGHELRDLLTRNVVPFGFYDAKSDEGAQLLRDYTLADTLFPAVILYGGTALVDPTNVEVAAALGVRTHPGTGLYDVAVVGAGPAGLAAVYGTSEGLRTVVVEHQAIGGQAGTSAMIRNYLGFPRGVSGS